MSHGVVVAGWKVPVRERVSTRRDEAAILISTLGRLLDIWVTPNDLQWQSDLDTPSYVHRGVTLRHSSIGVFDERGAPTDYLEGTLPCACGGHFRSHYMNGEDDLTRLLEGRDPLAIQYHTCTPSVIRDLAGSCPTCGHRLSRIPPRFTSCHYCGFQLLVRGDGSVKRENGIGAYVIRLHTGPRRTGRFVCPDEVEQWTSEVLASASTVARAYYTHQRDGVWQSAYLIGSPQPYDWLSPSIYVPGAEEQPVTWPA